MKLPHAYTRRRAVGLLSAEAFRLHMLALDWCAEQRTNGAITEDDISMLPRLPRSWRALTVELVAAGLWAQAETGWNIVDWDEMNGDAHLVPSDLSAKRAAAGRKGGLKTGEIRKRTAIDAPEEVKHQARLLMTAAIARGELVRGPCAVCGSQAVEGHHTDYSKPLDVVWLCARHHGQEHARLQAEKRSLLVANGELLAAKRSKVLPANSAITTNNITNNNC